VNAFKIDLDQQDWYDLYNASRDKVHTTEPALSEG